MTYIQRFISQRAYRGDVRLTIAQDDSYRLEILGRTIEFKTRPHPAEVNVLFALLEHGIGVKATLGDMCYRTDMGEVALRVRITRLRKKLSDNWVIEGLHKKTNDGGGFRLLWVGDQPE